MKGGQDIQHSNRKRWIYIELDTGLGSIGLGALVSKPADQVHHDRHEIY